MQLSVCGWRTSVLSIPTGLAVVTMFLSFFSLPPQQPISTEASKEKALKRSFLDRVYT